MNRNKKNTYSLLSLDIVRDLFRVLLTPISTLIAFF